MNVDWITEVIRRFSDAALAARPFTAVSMKNAVRVDKVRRFSFIPGPNFYLSRWLFSGQRRRRLTRMNYGAEKKLSLSRMQSCIITPNFAL
jgi:hypothetical protein